MVLSAPSTKSNLAEIELSVNLSYLCVLSAQIGRVAVHLRPRLPRGSRTFVRHIADHN